MIIPIRHDYQYRTVKKTQKPHTKAVVIYMMDVSGSMGDEQKEIVRLESFCYSAAFSQIIEQITIKAVSEVRLMTYHK